MSDIVSFDAYAPAEIARKVEAVGVTKAGLPLVPMFMLGVVAGGFIGLGGLYATLVLSDGTLPFAISRVLAGVVFALGLVLVVVAGAELFTGNNLLVIAWADGKLAGSRVLRNWLIVYLGNAAGALGLAVLVILAHHPDMNGGALGAQYLRIASSKAALPFAEAFYKGVLCNLLVCLAVWLAMAGRSVTDKIIAVVFPISAFVAAGFEHCIANMYLIPVGLILKLQGKVPPGLNVDALDLPGLLNNLVAVTLGNVLGGSLLVAFIYYAIYTRGLNRLP